MTPAPAQRVIVVDADRRIQAALAEVLRVAGVEIVGTAGDVRGAVELVETHAPDVMVVDPRLPDLDAGLALLSQLHVEWPALRMVLMGWSDDGASEAGASAYVAKSAQPEEFVAATLAACNC
jgi:DNA-binding NarL/FixJ family response regulator